MNVLDSIGKFLFFVLILDFTLEGLDQIHRIYEAEESFEIIKLLGFREIISYTFCFAGSGWTIIPLITLAFLQFYKHQIKLRKTIYFIVGILVLIGVYSMRWNVVIGGQLFSKSFSGFTSFKVGLIGLDGTLDGSILAITAIWDTCISCCGYCLPGKWLKRRVYFDLPDFE